MTKSQAIDEKAELVVCVDCSTIPISYLGFDLGTPIQGWPASLANRGIEVVVDDLGREAISRSDFAALIAERIERERRDVEDARRRAEDAPKRPVVVGVPAVPGGSAYESMLAATGLTTPSQEFGGRDKPTFLVDQLEAGAKALAEKRAQTAARNKERATAKLKKDVS